MRSVVRLYDRLAKQWLNPDDLNTTAADFGGVYPCIGDTVLLSAGDQASTRLPNGQGKAWTVTERVFRTVDWTDITLVLEPGDQSLVDELFTADG